MSDKSKTSHKKHKMTEGKKICSVGGQALMEGIMMLGPHGMAQVVRDPEGELVIKKQEITPWVRKNKFLGLAARTRRRYAGRFHAPGHESAFRFCRNCRCGRRSQLQAVKI